MLETQPDIAFAVTKLSQHAANPTEEHLNKALIFAATYWDPLTTLWSLMDPLTAV